MDAVVIRATRNGYYPNQCGHTMTVRELIEMLEDMPEDLPVFLSHDNGYTYGSIHESDISEDSFDD